MAIENWVNEKSIRNGTVAIHIAAYHGNPHIIKSLLNIGADHTIRNNNGIGIIHCAAQNNKGWPIVYFHNEYNMNVDIKDIDGNTPLHWACYFGATEAVSYLLKWSNCINDPNGNGETPLHLATKMTMSSGSMRLVKLLCFSGAMRDSRDLVGFTPLDYVKEAILKENEQSEVLKALSSILIEQS